MERTIDLAEAAISTRSNRQWEPFGNPNGWNGSVISCVLLVIGAYYVTSAFRSYGDRNILRLLSSRPRRRERRHRDALRPKAIV